MPGSSAEGGWSSATSSYTAVSSAVSGAIEREGGGRNNKYMAKMQQQCMTCLNDIKRCFTAYLNDLVNLGIYLDLFY